MKENKRILSAQVDMEVIEMLKEICKVEKRSQAKTLEVLIINAFTLLKSAENTRGFISNISA